LFSAVLEVCRHCVYRHGAGCDDQTRRQGRATSRLVPIFGVGDSSDAGRSNQPSKQRSSASACAVSKGSQLAALTTEDEGQTVIDPVQVPGALAPTCLTVALKIMLYTIGVPEDRH
jgi:hypothetical protein